jgi:hypothetical protein
MDAAAGDKDGATATDVVDVSPDGGRLVLFPSRKLLHAVLPVSERVPTIITLYGRHGVPHRETLAVDFRAPLRDLDLDLARPDEQASVPE